MSATAVKYDLNKIIRDELENTHLADPKEIALALLEEGIIPSSDYREALEATLPGYVREVIRLDRALTISEVDEPRSGHNNGSGRYQKALGGKPNQLLSTRHNTGTRWVTLGDMTRVDVEEIRGECERRAAEQNAAINRWNGVEKLFGRNKKAKTVSDLPYNDLTKIFK